MIIEVAPAKLNLALHVRARRPDGFHDLETLFAFCADGDLVTLTPADRWSLTISGPFAAGLSPNADNLVTRAALAFADRFGGRTDFAVTLEKRLPVASGIGGGSADAAATLRALARIGGVAPTDPALFATAAALGSDVPACLLGQAAIGRGRGAQLQPVPGLDGTPALLVNPGVGVSTARVFAGWDGIDRGTLPCGDAIAVARTGRNDLERAAGAVAPIIRDVLTELAAAAGAEVVRMSGSGATCFALFRDAAARDAAAADIASRRTNWWTLATSVD